MIILSFVLYGRKTWYLASREEHKLCTFEKKVLREVSGPKREDAGNR
jgi:hypothetical protein